ncbi:E3 ubiquitin-protein ligase rnf168 [Eucyclogobius newberryi]|uniref:E3 ubiquitin-protein ligase rnf168 n=1 Tax=Eucyclogobius newberryi TaxID=166745 RepID=UPI003B599ABB
MTPGSDSKVEGGDGRSLSREDCLCPICLEVFVEPVTLPCAHTFCKVCFLESVYKATLCCPLCRKRVSTWARLHNRKNSLVNEALWKKIQSTFPQSERRLQGPGPDHEPLSFRRLSEPGALRQEYEDQVSKLSEEKRELEEQERRASEVLIQRLLAEEEELLMEQRRRHEDDEKLARHLSKELNAAGASGQNQVPATTPVKKKPMGQIHRFLCPLSRSHAHSVQANKENISLQPTSSAEPPQLDFYGPETDQSHHAEPHHAEPHHAEPHHREAPVIVDQSERGDRSSEGGTKWTSEAWSEEEDRQSSGLMGEAMAEIEAELQKRRRQEEEDLRVALELQRQLDSQWRQTDRRKGSEDAYPLRASTRLREDAAPARKRPATAATPTRPATKRRCASSRQSTPPSAPKPAKACQKSPPTLKSTRQTTLTNLFNLHT